jgi:hypothetical protein
VGGGGAFIGVRLGDRLDEGEAGPVADEVANAPPVLAGGCRDEQLRDIEGNNTGAPARQQVGVMSLTAAQIKTQQPIDRRQQREKRRGGCPGPSGLRILIGSSPERTGSSVREIPEVYS